MDILPLTPNCEQNYNSKEHVCFGISPFNSFFSESRIEKLATWGKNEFKSMHLFIPDEPSAYTLEALGYSPKDADWKARRQCRWLKNKVKRALVNVGYTDEEIASIVLDWKALSKNPSYLESYALVQKAFETDTEFKNACLEASKWVLESRVQDTSELTPEMLNSACRYLLTEIPMFINTPNIAQKNSSVFCYHQCVPIIENLFKRKFSIMTSQNQGFVVLNS